MNNAYAENQYAAWEDEGRFFSNPNCYGTNVRRVGDVVGTATCVFVGSQQEAQQYVAERAAPPVMLFDLI